MKIKKMVTIDSKKLHPVAKEFDNNLIMGVCRSFDLIRGLKESQKQYEKFIKDFLDEINGDKI